MVFCSKHLGANIRRAISDLSQTLLALWELITGKITEDEFLATSEFGSRLHLVNRP
jgi:hypothetical protein